MTKGRRNWKRALLALAVLGWQMLGLAGGQALAAAPGAPVAASPAVGAKPLRVQVGRFGFRPPRLEVAQGERVAITFVYADTDLDYPNPHIIRLKEYGLQTGEISPASPEATLTFTASQSGRITMACVGQCQGHQELQDGILAVTAGATVRPTLLSLAAAPRARGESGFRLVATLRDEAGNPVAGVPVLFTRAAALLAGQTPQPVRLGEALSALDGTATIAWVPRAAGPEQLTVQFTGTGGLGPSDSNLSLNVPASAALQYVNAPARVGLPVGNWLIFAVLAFVWSLYGTALYQLVRIALASKGHVAATLPHPAAYHLDSPPDAGPTWRVLVSRPALLTVFSTGIILLGSTLWAGRYQAALAGNAHMHSSQQEHLLAEVADVATRLAALESSLESSLQKAAPAAAVERLAGATAGLARQVQEVGAMLATVQRDVAGLQGDMRSTAASVGRLAAREPVAASAGTGGGTAPAAVAGAATPPATADTGNRVAGVVEFTIEAFNYGWAPQRIEVRRGDRVRLTIRNNPQRHSPGMADPDPNLLDHGLGIEAFGVDARVPKGTSQVVEFVADQAGEFPMVCTVWCGVGRMADGSRRGHPEMAGTLIVR